MKRIGLVAPASPAGDRGLFAEFNKIPRRKNAPGLPDPSCLFSNFLGLDEKVRAFIAVDLNEEIRGNIAEIQSALGRFSSLVRWVSPASIHMTLKFLGEISPDQQKRLTALLANRKCPVPPFAITVEHMGFFPHACSPRVTWLGVEEGKDSLQQLARYVEDVAADAGFLREERPFSPHITFGRIKFLPDVKRFLEATAPYSELHCGTVQVRQFHLYESQLRRNGAIYAKRATFELE